MLVSCAAELSRAQQINRWLDAWQAKDAACQEVAMAWGQPTKREKKGSSEIWTYYFDYGRVSTVGYWNNIGYGESHDQYDNIEMEFEDCILLHYRIHVRR